MAMNTQKNKKKTYRSTLFLSLSIGLLTGILLGSLTLDPSSSTTLFTTSAWHLLHYSDPGNLNLPFAHQTPLISSTMVTPTVYTQLFPQKLHIPVSFPTAHFSHLGISLLQHDYNLDTYNTVMGLGQKLSLDNGHHYLTLFGKNSVVQTVSSQFHHSPPGLRHTKRRASQTLRIFNFIWSSSTLNGTPVLSFQRRPAPERKASHSSCPQSCDAEYILPLDDRNAKNWNDSTSRRFHRPNIPKPLLPPTWHHIWVCQKARIHSLQKSHPHWARIIFIIMMRLKLCSLHRTCHHS